MTVTYSGAHYTVSKADPKFVVQYGKAQLWAGGYQGAKSQFWSLLIGLETSVPAKQEVGFLFGASQLFDDEVRNAAVQPAVHIPVQDRGVPGLPRPWWIKFAKNLSEIEGPVYVHCMGGTGRTGTVLALLLGCMEEIGLTPPADDLVSWLRDNYYEEAIESAMQMAFVKSFGIKTKEIASDDWVKAKQAAQAKWPAPTLYDEHGVITNASSIKADMALTDEELGKKYQVYGGY